MLRPHTRRILSLRPLRPPNRLFTQPSRARPNVVFLSPTRFRRQTRLLTTERKKWLKSEVVKGLKYAAWGYAAMAMFCAFSVGYGTEMAERRYPPPPEWSFKSRVDYTGGLYFQQDILLGKGLERTEAEEQDPVERIKKLPEVSRWPDSYRNFKNLMKRLEDPAIDGHGVKEQEEGGILVEGIGKTGLDVSEKSEEWRRGYHVAIMAMGAACEHLDGWVVDRTREKAFPANTVKGPSNRNPRPVPPGHTAPREEDCDYNTFDPPEKYYLKVLTTRGFNDRQRLDAALAYATWLDIKGTPGTALEMVNWGLEIAAGSSDDAKASFDPKTGIINKSSKLVSANVLAATTGLALHHAHNMNLAGALPIFLSVLRARRSLPDVPQELIPDIEEEPTLFSSLKSSIRTLLIRKEHPPLPLDGTLPPVRDAVEKCEEAGLMAYIGEILYVSNKSKSGPEDGLAWTREAVDIAEEELRGPGLKGVRRWEEPRKKCEVCLETGLVNWAKMVAKLAREEREKKANPSNSKAGSWFGVADNQQQVAVGRWESEAKFVQGRLKRAEDVLGTAFKRADHSALLV